MMKKIYLLPILLGLGNYAFADHTPRHHCLVGQVTSVKGTVELERKSNKITPVEGTKICKGDKFTTAQGSVAELKLRDGTKLTVGRDSQLVIREYKIYRKQPNVALFDLLQGAFRSITGSITKRPHKFEVNTGVATIGVRGTDFWGGYGVTPDGALDVIMLSGKGVYIKNDNGQVELDKAGLGTTIKADGTLGEVKAWPEEKVGRAVATITPD
ncbi:MAG: FecR domain-containing protein [Moraxellaceae bacterium]|jgi:hypothetical protein|nr:FecR domain-containing protein [Moraxellaceae bacterium]